MNQLNPPEAPWYAPSSKKKPAMDASTRNTPEQAPRTIHIFIKIFKQLFRLRAFFFAGIALSIFSFLGAHALASGSSTFVVVSLMAAGLLIAFFIIFVFLGAELKKILTLHASESALTVACLWMRGQLQQEKGHRGPPAPELALNQFVSQVRAYASEKSFQNAKPGPDKSFSEFGSSSTEGAPLLKRRWNEVVDSLDEFEIYLANDPRGMIGKLVSKNPPKQIDAAVVFRDVAETFDTTWRRKGINIESAIVTPLKATTHEGLLRRLLVGPWRTSAYFARRGASVVFSAKSLQGRVVARWEVDGLSIPEEYLAVVQDSSLSVNDRIEKGLLTLAPEPANSPNTLYALISFVTWIDLAHACETDFEFKNTNNGFVIEIRLK